MTTDIRPQRQHDAYQKLADGDRDAVVSASRGRWVARKCPGCDADAAAILYAAEGFDYHRCLVCSTVYLKNIPPAEILDDYYRNAKSSSHFHEHILLPSSEVRKKTLFEPRVKTVKEYAAGGIWLDVGCAIGTSLEAIQAAGFDARGIELNAVARKIATDKGLKVEACDVSGLGWEDNSIKVISLFEVLAHVVNPLQTLNSCARLLDQCGILMLTTPNVAGYEYQVLENHHPNMHFPFLNLFSFATLARMVSDCGFEIISHVTPGNNDLATIGEVMAKGLNCGLTDLEKRLILNLQDSEARDLQLLIKRLSLSGHQQIIARPKKK